MPLHYLTRNTGKALRAKKCPDSVVEILNNHIIIPINGKLDQKTIIRTMVGMAVEGQLIHSIRNHLTLVPCKTSCRYHLAKLLDLEGQEQKSSTILWDLPFSVLETGKSYPFAIDYTDDPYYGEIGDENVFAHLILTPGAHSKLTPPPCTDDPYKEKRRG